VSISTKDLVNQFLALDTRKRDLKAVLTQVEAELQRLEPEILDRFERAGVQRMTMTDGTTAYIRRDLRVRAADGDTERVIEALKESGLGDMVAEKFNTNTLAAYVREQARQHETNGDGPLSPEAIKVMLGDLGETLAIYEQFSVNTTKGR